METEFAIGTARLAEALDPSVRHNVLVCVPCTSKYPSIDHLIGKGVITICGVAIIYKMSLTWCEDCIVVRQAEAYERVCGLCGQEIVRVRG